MQTGFVSIGSLEVHYRREGDGAGPPWVFVHGIGEDLSSWTAQQEALALDHTTYAIDVRGHGTTELGADAKGSVQQLADDLLGFLATVGPSVCIGFSMGGTIVLAAAASQKSRLIERAVGVCTSSVVGRRAAMQFRADADSIDTAGGGRAARTAVDRFLTASVQRKPQGWNVQRAARLAAVGDGRGYANAARAMASLQETPLGPKLSEIDCPIDILVGEYDEACPQRAGEAIVSAVPDGRIHLIPNVGHFVGIEDPTLLTRKLRALREGV